jgi:hypothetical protein
LVCEHIEKEVKKLEVPQRNRSVTPLFFYKGSVKLLSEAELARINRSHYCRRYQKHLDPNREKGEKE